MTTKKLTKESGDVALKGIKADIEVLDTDGISVTARITLTDSNGRELVVQRGEYRGVEVLVTPPPKRVSRYNLQGDLEGGVQVNETLAEEVDAQERRREIIQGHPDAVLLIHELEVEVDADGNETVIRRKHPGHGRDISA